MIRLRPPSRWPVFVFLAVSAVGCGSDLLLPDPPGGGDNLALSKITGDGQTGTVGELLPDPLVVQVLTARALPAPGRRVEFVFTSSAGDVSPAVATTNEEGKATAHWVLGPEQGDQSIQARMADVEGESQTAEFKARAKPAAPDTLSAQTAVSQPGRRGQEVNTPPVVRVVDRFGNPVSGVSVAWSVATGQGVVGEPITQTGEDGTSTVKWTLGGRVGVHRLTAAIGQVHGSPVTFTATVLF
jgi:hypothetical protein